MRQTLFSGVKPSGDLHLGNYIGALTLWAELAKKSKAYFCIVDMHAITVPQDAKEMRRRTREIAAAYIAAGIDPKKDPIFVQSDVPAHAELGWILGTQTRLGELERMTQYKEKTATSAKKGIPTGLLMYPTLMAADILLYKTTMVPVGEDQIQHVELARDIAKRFNNKYGETFVVPRPEVHKIGARVMSLDDPTKKMSKSDERPNAAIMLTDDEVTIRRKIKKAVTDSGSEIAYDPKNRPAISNLLAIFHHMTGRPIADIAKEYADQGYGVFKEALADAVVAELAPFQKEMNALIKDKKALDAILADGAEAASKEANKTITKVKQLMGLGL